MLTSERDITRYLLQFCYSCEEARSCETEAKCEACFEEAGLLELGEQAELTTEQLLRMYAY